MKTAGILLVYSEAFADTAIRLFVRMLRRLDADATLVVVNNNERLQLGSYPGVTVLRGGNFLHEFGAWQTGLDHVRAQDATGQLQVAVLANDTFCHYRPMGALEQAAFLQGAKSCANARGPQACGELAPLPGRGEFTFDGVRMHSWIATYFFALNRAALDGIGWAMHPSMAQVERWVPGGLDEQRFFAADLEPALHTHWRAWLFGSDSIPTWRRSQPLSAQTQAMMLGKAHALVCEMDLSARLLRAGTRIRSVLHAPGLYLVKHLVLRMWP